MISRTLRWALPLAALLLAATGAQAGTIRVDVSGFRNGSGTLLCALFNRAAEFPDGTALLRTRTPARANGAQCVFKDVAPGRYAVAVVHDENDNGHMDRVPLIGLPLEGYGVSNNHTYAMHGPRFAESAFTYDGTAELTLRIVLRY